ECREWLDEDVDLAAARKADAERHVVGDAVGEEPRRGAGEHLLGGKRDVALDATARDGACELPARADPELRPDRARRRRACGDDRREGDPLAARAPALDVGGELVHASMVRVEPRATFGTVAEAYDRARPTYPAELFEDLRDLTEGNRLLEIG